jgi:hypothetical protein
VQEETTRGKGWRGSRAEAQGAAVLLVVRTGIGAAWAHGMQEGGAVLQGTRGGKGRRSWRRRCFRGAGGGRAGRKGRRMTALQENRGEVAMQGCA